MLINVAKLPALSSQSLGYLSPSSDQTSSEAALLGLSNHDPRCEWVVAGRRGVVSECRVA